MIKEMLIVESHVVQSLPSLKRYIIEITDNSIIVLFPILRNKNEF